MGNFKARIEMDVSRATLDAQRISRRRLIPSVSRRKPRVEVVDESGGIVTFDKYQISSVGAFLFSQFLYSEGEKLQLRLSLPTVDRPLLIEGEVVNANVGNDAGMGIAFRKVNVRDKRLLQDYVARRFVKNV